MSETSYTFLRSTNLVFEIWSMNTAGKTLIFYENGKQKKFRTCGNPSCDSVGKLKLCSGCKVIAYCSTECQNLDWKTHQAGCKKVRQYHLQNPDFLKTNQRFIKLFRKDFQEIMADYEKRSRPKGIYILNLDKSKETQCVIWTFYSIQECVDGEIHMTKEYIDSIQSKDANTLFAGFVLGSMDVQCIIHPTIL